MKRGAKEADIERGCMVRRAKERKTSKDNKLCTVYTRKEKIYAKIRALKTKEHNGLNIIFLHLKYRTNAMSLD